MVLILPSFPPKVRGQGSGVRGQAPLPAPLKSDAVNQKPGVRDLEAKGQRAKAKGPPPTPAERRSALNRGHCEEPEATRGNLPVTEARAQRVIHSSIVFQKVGLCFFCQKFIERFWLFTEKMNDFDGFFFQTPPSLQHIINIRTDLCPVCIWI